MSTTMHLCITNLVALCLILSLPSFEAVLPSRLLLLEHFVFTVWGQKVIPYRALSAASMPVQSRALLSANEKRFDGSRDSLGEHRADVSCGSH